MNPRASSIPSQAASPLPVRFRGSRLAHAALRLLGWRLIYHGFVARQGVAIVYPHTSNWDFPLGLLVKWATGIPVRFWGKDSLFRVPLLGAWMRWLGGIALDRSTARGAVGEMVAQFEQARAADSVFWLALSPEGTRRHTPGWRSGFYQVAQQARVPLLLVRFDVAQRTVDLSHFFWPTGKMQADFERLAQHFSSASGFKPAGASPVQALPSSHVFRP